MCFRNVTCPIPSTPPRANERGDHGQAPEALRRDAASPSAGWKGEGGVEGGPSTLSIRILARASPGGICWVGAGARGVTGLPGGHGRFLWWVRAGCASRRGDPESRGQARREGPSLVCARIQTGESARPWAGMRPTPPSSRRPQAASGIVAAQASQARAACPGQAQAAASPTRSFPGVRGRRPRGRWVAGDLGSGEGGGSGPSLTNPSRTASPRLTSPYRAILKTDHQRQL